MARAHPVIVGITGATGVIYGVRLLERLREALVETHRGGSGEASAKRWAPRAGWLDKPGVGFEMLSNY